MITEKITDLEEVIIHIIELPPLDTAIIIQLWRKLDRVVSVGNRPSPDKLDQKRKEKSDSWHLTADT